MSADELRAQIVAAARTWLGTKFQHQARLKGVGVDCAGVVIGVAKECGLSEFDITGYSHQPDPLVFRASVRDNLRLITFAEALPGDIVTMRYDREQHLAIITQVDPLVGVHSYARLKRCVEGPLELERIVDCYRFPQLWAH